MKLSKKNLGTFTSLNEPLKINTLSLHKHWNLFKIKARKMLTVT